MIKDLFIFESRMSEEMRNSEKPENQAGILRRFSDYSESQTRGSSAMRLRLGGRNDGMLHPSPLGRGREGEGAALSPLPLGEGGTECRVRVKKAAFTLSEVLITLLIVGVIAAVTIPALQKAMPNKLEAMRRKTYHTLENTVAQMITDDVMYRPRAVYNGASFQNTEPSNYNGTLYSGNTKFCELFANALTKRTNATCTADEKTFTAADNVDWYLPVTDFSKGYAAIKFDVNGKAEPNCEYTATTCEKPDTFTYYIMANGRILEQDPKLTPPTYCIKTTITGEGTVSPSENYCGLVNGTYTLTAVPAENWLSNWANDKRTITIQDSDATAEVVFTEAPKACINLTVDCETGAPDNCGSYSITNGTFKTDGNTLKACDLYTNTYTVTVSPKTNFTSDWQTKEVNLNGVDQNLTVTLKENKYCAILNVTCPGGGANICGTYEISGNGTTYGMDISGNVAKNCVLTNASYTLAITANAGYKTSDTSKSFTISNNDWESDVEFQNINPCDAGGRGYIEIAGKKWSCPFIPTPATLAECLEMVGKLGINACKYSNSIDYWAGAVKHCGGVDKMPTMTDLASIASAIYDGNPSIGEKQKLNLTYTSGTATSLGLPEPPFTMWSGEEYSSSSAYTRYFYQTGTELDYGTRYGYYLGSHADSYNNAICRID